MHRLQIGHLFRIYFIFARNYYWFMRGSRRCVYLQPVESTLLFELLVLRLESVRGGGGGGGFLRLCIVSAETFSCFFFDFNFHHPLSTESAETVPKPNNAT